MGIESGAMRLDQMMRGNRIKSLVCVQDVDVNAYLADEESTKILPASYWLDKEGEEAHAVRVYEYPWERLQGRFRMRSGELTLWTGWGKHGKSTALMQSCLCAMSQGARVGVISLEFSVPMLIRLLREQSFGYTNVGETQRNRDEWREWVDEKLWLYDHHGMQEGLRIAAVVWHMAKKMSLDVIVVDSLMMCGVRSDGDGFATAQTDFINRLVNVCRDNPVHIHLVAHSRKDKDDLRPARLLDVSGSGNLVNIPHNIVGVWKNKQAPEKREQDAIFSVLGDRVGGMDGDLDLWWHATSRQFIDSREGLPRNYVKSK